MNATIYNVTEDRDDWARVKVGLMTFSDREALLRRLIMEDHRAASRVLSDIISAEHGARVEARSKT